MTEGWCCSACVLDSRLTTNDVKRTAMAKFVPDQLVVSRAEVVHNMSAP
jgi:hypothetical protein